MVFAQTWFCGAVALADASCRFARKLRAQMLASSTAKAVPEAVLPGYRSAQ